MPLFSKLVHLVTLSVLISLTGCSEYLDRTDTMSWQSGNAMQTNKVTHMVDPWPPESANRNIAFNGAVIETAITRYRTGKVIRPKGLSSDPAPVTPPPAASNAPPVGPSVTANAPVK